MVEWKCTKYIDNIFSDGRHDLFELKLYNNIKTRICITRNSRNFGFYQFYIQNPLNEIYSSFEKIENINIEQYNENDYGFKMEYRSIHDINKYSHNVDLFIQIIEKYIAPISDLDKFEMKNFIVI
jgi:hypothetical protein